MDRKDIAPVRGLEPRTRGLTVHCSNQLSYTGIISIKDKIFKLNINYFWKWFYYLLNSLESNSEQFMNFPKNSTNPICEARGKPPTWLPRGWLVEQSRIFLCSKILLRCSCNISNTFLICLIFIFCLHFFHFYKSE